MAWKTWTTGEVLTAADLNKLSPIICTSTTRPTGGAVYEGAVIYETDTDLVYVYNGSSWVRLVGAGSIVNADVSASAAIAYSKLALSGSVTNADLAGSIAYSKLSLSNSITNADLAGSITYSKLAAVPRVRLRRAANQSQGAGEFAISWDTEDTDTNGYWSSGTTVTVPAGLGGMYSLAGRFTASAGLSGASYCYVYINSATKYTYYVPSGNDNGSFSFTGLLGDSATVVVYCYNPSGTVNFQANFEMVRLGGV